MVEQSDELQLWLFKVACILRTIQISPGIVERHAEEMESQLRLLADKMPEDLSVSASIYVMEALDALRRET